MIDDCSCHVIISSKHFLLDVFDLILLTLLFGSNVLFFCFFGSMDIDIQTFVSVVLVLYNAFEYYAT